MDTRLMSETPEEAQKRIARWENARVTPSTQRADNEIARRNLSEITKVEAEFLLSIAHDLDARINDQLEGGR